MSGNVQKEYFEKSYNVSNKLTPQKYWQFEILDLNKRLLPSKFV